MCFAGDACLFFTIPSAQFCAYCVNLLLLCLRRRQSSASVVLLTSHVHSNMNLFAYFCVHTIFDWLLVFDGIDFRTTFGKTMFAHYLLFFALNDDAIDM